jgi:hypothetical protein
MGGVVWRLRGSAVRVGGRVARDRGVTAHLALQLLLDHLGQAAGQAGHLAGELLSSISVPSLVPALSSMPVDMVARACSSSAAA